MSDLPIKTDHPILTSLGFATTIFYGTRSSTLKLTPNLEEEDSVFMSPSVSQGGPVLSPGTGLPFSSPSTTRRSAMENRNCKASIGPLILSQQQKKHFDIEDRVRVQSPIYIRGQADAIGVGHLSMRSPDILQPSN
jgi:hypothetical protein